MLKVGIDAGMQVLVIAPVIGSDLLAEHLNARRQPCLLPLEANTVSGIDVEERCTVLVGDGSRAKCIPVFQLARIDQERKAGFFCCFCQCQLLPGGTHRFICRIAEKTGVKILCIEVSFVCSTPQHQPPLFVQLS